MMRTLPILFALFGASACSDGGTATVASECLLIRYGSSDRSQFIARLDKALLDTGFTKDAGSDGHTRYKLEQVDVILLHGPHEFGDVLSVHGPIEAMRLTSIRSAAQTPGGSGVVECKAVKGLTPPVLMDDKN